MARQEGNENTTGIDRVWVRVCRFWLAGVALWVKIDTSDGLLRGVAESHRQFYPQTWCQTFTAQQIKLIKRRRWRWQGPRLAWDKQSLASSAIHIVCCCFCLKHLHSTQLAFIHSLSRDCTLNSTKNMAICIERMWRSWSFVVALSVEFVESILLL